MKIPFGGLVLCVTLSAAWAVAGQAPDAKALFARCQGCHGADGTKVPMNVGKPLKGMSAQEIKKDLEGYKAKTFGGEKKAIMEKIVVPLSEPEIEALAQYIAKF